MMRKIVVVALACGLAGCGSAREAENQKMQAAVAADRSACDENYKSKQIKTYAGYMQCINTAEAPLGANLGRSGFGDLWSVKAAGRVAIAERVDKGEITPAQADLEMAKLNASLVSEGQNRLNVRRAVDAQYEAASAASKPVTCNRFGNSVTCF